MPFDPRNFSIDDALASSQDLYEVQFTSWGVRTVAPSAQAVNPNFQFPPPGAKALPSLAAMAIGPRSTVDRCWVSWNRQKIAGAAGFGVPTVESRLRPLSVDHPLAFAQANSRDQILPSIELPPTKNNDPATAMHLGLLYVFPKESGSAGDTETDARGTTILPAKYNDEAGNAWFLGAGNAGTVFFEAPYLELYLYLTPPILPLPSARFPYLLSAVGTPGAANSFVPIAQIPIFGRRHVGIGLVNENAQSTDYRIGLMRCTRENSGITTAPPFDVPGGTALGVASKQTVNFNLDHPCADYLNIYAKVGSILGAINIDVAAYD